MICDAHAHYGDRRLMEKVTAESALRDKFPCYKTIQFEHMDDCDDYMRAQGDEKIAYIPFVFRELSKPEENRKMLEYAESRAFVYPYVLLDEDDVTFVRENYKKIVGVKEHIVMHETALSDRRVEVFGDVNRYNLNILLHTKFAVRVDYIKSILELFPHVKIHVAHLGRSTPDNLQFIYDILAALKAYENVFFDTSTIRQTEALEQAVGIVGRERILYGSDFPFFIGDGSENIVKTQIDHVLNAKITGLDREYIFQKNFERLIKKGE